MFVLPDKNTIYFDCDDTLVMWDQWHREEEFLTFAEKRYQSVNVAPHKYHIEQLKKHKASGHIIVVWSQGGAEWAETLVKTLELEEFVDAVMCKPHWYYDDLPSSAFMGRNLWYNEKGEHSNPHTEKEIQMAIKVADNKIEQDDDPTDSE